MNTLAPRLDLRQSQNLVMTPQLQQAIKLLQLSNVELSEYIDGELAQNPLLDRADADGAKTEDSAPVDEAASAGDSDGGDEVRQEFDDAWTGNEAEAPARSEAETLPDFDPGSGMATVGAGGSTSFDDPDQSFENRMSRAETLRDHLQAQMHMTFDDARDLLLAAQLIDALDEQGYLRTDTAELCERLACPPERLDRILGSLRQFDPTGIFAHDLRDCLQLQLQEQERFDAPMATLLDNLSLLAAHDYAGLARACQVNDTYLRDMVAELRALNPRPASAFETLTVQTAVPDVLMKRLPKNLGGGWRLELNSETLPRVLVNETYYTEVAGHAKNREDKTYLSQQLQNAHWLVRSLDQRAKTILKVAAEIVEQQDAFFLYGIEYLKPMTLKDIAEKIDMHESTVSRVTTSKYIGTPRGVLELKWFFQAALGEGSGAHSSESVRARIKVLIEAEDPKKPLSDDALADMLVKEGVDIARRTVAKYREALRIPSSTQRRRMKK